jgi:hypothetical protein
MAGTAMSGAWLKTRIDELVHASCTRGEPISVKEMRLRLEKESGRSLDSQREQIKALIHEASERATKPASASESESESSEELPSKKQRAAAKKAAPKKPEHAQSKPPPAAPTGALWESAPAKLLAKVLAARAAIKKAGLAARLASIKGVRTMEAAEVLARLYAILESAGLGETPTKQQLAEHAAKLALERELDGISTANIIAAPEAPGASVGRRPRRKIDDDDLYYAPPSPAERNLDEADGAAIDDSRAAAAAAQHKRRRSIVESDSE